MSDKNLRITQDHAGRRLDNFLFNVLLLIFTLNTVSQAEVPYYLDFKLILNESVAGKKAQTSLKKKLENGFKSI